MLRRKPSKTPSFAVKEISPEEWQRVLRTAKHGRKPKMPKTDAEARTQFLSLLGRRQKKLADVNREIFGALTERQAVRKWSHKVAVKELALIEEMCAGNEKKREYVVASFKKAKKLFGEKLENSDYLKRVVEHLATEYDLLKEEKGGIGVSKRYSPFYVSRIREHVGRELPVDLKSLSGTVAHQVFEKRYASVSDAVSRLKQLHVFFKELERGLNVRLSGFVERTLMKYALSYRKLSAEQAFDNVLKYVRLPAKIFSLDLPAYKGGSRGTKHEIVGDALAREPEKLLLEKERMLRDMRVIGELIEFLGEDAFETVLQCIENNEPVPTRLLAKIKQFKKKIK